MLKRNLSEYWQWIIRSYKEILIVFLISLGLLCISYISTNLKFSLFNDTLVTKLTYAIRHSFTRSSCIPDNLVLINTHYDKYLADAYEGTEKKGKACITDRKVVYEFLNKLDSTGCTYNYIFIDIAFSSTYLTPWDSLLYDKIRTMERVVVAYSDDLPRNFGILQKSGLVDYNTTLLVDGFNKYILSTIDKPSFALKAYQDLGYGDIKSICGLIWYDDGLAVRCVTPKLRLNIVDNNKPTNAPPALFKNAKEHKNLILNLGCEVLDEFDDFVDDNGDLFKGKNILIGDFITDKHPTYAGEQAGPTINYNAFLTILNREHIIRWWQALLVFIVIFTLTFIANSTSFNSLNRVPSIIILLIEFLLIWILGIILFWICGQTFDILIVTFFLSFYKDIRLFK